MIPSDLAPVVGANAVTDERWLLIERIALSPHLKSSARLRDFLFYVADCAIRVSPEEATEQQIGIHVFQRSPGYNSSEDSIVRTHARLLRQKLAAYFAEEGSDEEFIVEIPKGHYLPVFHLRSADVDLRPPQVSLRPSKVEAARIETAREESATQIPSPAAFDAQAVSHAVPWTSRIRRHHLWWVLLLLPAMVAWALLLWKPWNRLSASQSPVTRFWQPFFSEDPPLVIFSNALFVGDSKTGLRYAQPDDQASSPGTDKQAGNSDYVDTYTGIGELASVYTLTSLFDAHRSHFILKRSLLMTWDEARTKNLIFIGSVAENPSLRVLESTTDFTIVAHPGVAGVVNHHPRPGEPETYSRAERPLSRDYAILALLPGIQPGKRMLIFSGLTTFGTQAAVDFICRPESMAELLPQITGSKGEVRPFEAVLETNIGGGVPLQTRLVTLRVH